MNKQWIKRYHATINDCDHVYIVKLSFENIASHNYNIKLHHINYIQLSWLKNFEIFESRAKSNQHVKNNIHDL